MVKLKNKYGDVEIDKAVIQTIIGGAVIDNYGVVGMASHNQLKDNMDELLRKENYHRGIVLHDAPQGLIVDVNVIVGYGTKISEVSRSIQAKVKYNLKMLLGISVQTVNIIVKGVKVLDN